jgi:hypothetical protein
VAALRRMDDLEAQFAPLHAQIVAFARRQAACKTLAAELYGVGPLVAAIMWAFLGDARWFSSAQAVRHTGLDVTMCASDDKRTRGHLSHQGPPILRWALSGTIRDHGLPPPTSAAGPASPAPADIAAAHAPQPGRTRKRNRTGIRSQLRGSTIQLSRSLVAAAHRQ